MINTRPTARGTGRRLRSSKGVSADALVRLVWLARATGGNPRAAAPAGHPSLAGPRRAPFTALAPQVSLLPAPRAPVDSAPRGGGGRGRLSTDGPGSARACRPSAETPSPAWRAPSGTGGHRAPPYDFTFIILMLFTPALYYLIPSFLLEQVLALRCSTSATRQEISHINYR